MTKPSAEMYMRGGGVKVINWLGGGGGGTVYMYEQQSIVNTGHVNAVFKHQTHNRYMYQC